jgi:hypothetical protein
VAERQDLAAGADLYAARARGNRAGDSERRGQHRAARLLMNFGQPDRIEAQQSAASICASASSNASAGVCSGRQWNSW